MKFLLGIPWLSALLVATPFGVISSAVAIPSAESLNEGDREFVIYESSWSDIFGVMLFDALLVSAEGGAVTTHLLGGSLAVLCVGAMMALAFYWLVGHLEEQVKFLPLLFGIILVYASADSLHLSPLLIVLILGLTLNNSRLLRRFKVLDRLHSGHYGNELERLKHLTSEATFLVRTFFFLLLGYVTDLHVFIDARAWMFATAIVAIILALRWIMLRVMSKGKTRPLLWLAPRGLITATLFFSMPKNLLPSAFPPGALILVVLLSCIVMVVGLQIDQRRKTASPLRLVINPALEELCKNRIASIKHFRQISTGDRRRKPALRRAFSAGSLPIRSSTTATPARRRNETESPHRSAA